MATSKRIEQLKQRIDQLVIQRDHWKQLAENRNSIVVTEVCPESRSVEEYVIDADSVRASWRLIRGYREQSEALREECEHLRACQENAMLHMTWLVAERDTLRQQLAERDATIERLEAGIPRIQEQSHQMRKVRDKLEGLLLDLWEYTHDPELEQRIEAALAEVKP